MVKLTDTNSPYDSDTTVIPSADKGKNVIRENTLNTEAGPPYLSDTASSYISSVRKSGINLYQSVKNSSISFLDSVKGGKFYTYDEFDLLSRENQFITEQAFKLIPGHKNQYSVLTASAFDSLGVPVKGGFYLRYYDTYREIPTNTIALGVLSDLDSWPDLNSDLVLKGVNSVHPYKTWLLLDKKFQDSASPLNSSSAYASPSNSPPPPAGNHPLESVSTPVETGNLVSRSGGDGDRAPWLDRKPKESVTPLNTEDLPTTGWNESPMEKPSTTADASSLPTENGVWGASETPSQSPLTVRKPDEATIILTPATPVTNTPTNSLASPLLDANNNASTSKNTSSKFAENLRKAGAKAFDIDTSVKSDSSGPKSAPLPSSKYSFQLGLNPTRVNSSVISIVGETPESSPQVELEQPGLAGKSVLLSASMSDALANEISDTDVSNIPGFTD